MIYNRGIYNRGSKDSKDGVMVVARDPSYHTIHYSLSLPSLSYLFFAGHIEIHLGLISLFAYLTDNLPPDFLFVIIIMGENNNKAATPIPLKICSRTRPVIFDLN